MAQNLNGRDGAKTGATKGDRLVRRHYLVAIQELGVRLGGSNTVRREVLVDVGNASSLPDAEEKAKLRVARTLKTNVVCLQVSASRVAEPIVTVLYDSAQVDKAFSVAAEPAQQFVQVGNLRLKVRSE